MARNTFTAQMEDYLDEIIQTGENGNIYRCLVLRADNQKIKMSPFFLYYIIVAVWEYLFFLTSPIHNSAAVKAKAANWDALRCFATFTLRNRKFSSSKTSLETRRDEMFWDEFYGPASGVGNTRIPPIYDPVEKGRSISTLFKLCSIDIEKSWKERDIQHCS